MTLAGGVAVVAGTGGVRALFSGLGGLDSSGVPGEIVAIDGKTLRRSHDRAVGVAPLHLVSAWATANRMVLRQVVTEGKSNKIAAIPRLLESLLLKGCIVTIDAMGCQTKIAKQIIGEGGDYVFAQKYVDRCDRTNSPCVSLRH